MRRVPRKRRQVSKGTLRFARVCGFRYDDQRDAYVLRGVGNRFGPVLRSRPPVDSMAAQMEWSETMDELAERRKSAAATASRGYILDALCRAPFAPWPPALLWPGWRRPSCAIG